MATAVVTSAMLRTWPVRLPAIRLTLSVRSFQVPATPSTRAWPPSLPSVPTSRATRVTSEAKLLSWSTMVLMVFFSSSTSPFTSTVILRDRSPRATAVVTSAMLRTWPVRLPAIRLTLSVRSFQVPATPLTLAWPPSLPSVPTSRATRVTSEAKLLSWSTMVLMVFFSSSTSPFTSTVILRLRSPLATAVVTSAMLRTWPVRLAAIRLTLSVRSFQVPATPFTWAWPPSLPSVPTSRATRVTSEANEPSWPTMVLTTLPMRRNSPRSGRSSFSRSMVWERSPLAVAPITRAISAVGWTMSVIRLLTASTLAAHEPVAPGRRARWLILPCFADDVAEPFELFRHLVVQIDGVVERLGQFAVQAGQVGRQAHGEVAAPEGAQGGQELVVVEPALLRLGLCRRHRNTPRRNRSIYVGGAGGKADTGVQSALSRSTS
jgi:hypothetical protein